MSIDIINKFKIINIKKYSHKFRFSDFLLIIFFCQFIESIAIVNTCKRICVCQYLKFVFYFLLIPATSG